MDKRLPSRGKIARDWSYHSSVSTAELKNECSYISTPLPLHKVQSNFYITR
jgi:hypothetical protein